MGHEGLDAYLKEVGTQIRWRRARKPLLRELADHVADQARAFQAAGASEDEALARAVAEMGDPASVGRALDRLHRPRTRWELVLFTALLLALGLAAQQLLLRGEPDGLSYLIRQAAGMLAGAVLFAAVWLSDYTLLTRRRWTPPLCLAGLVALSLGSMRLGYGPDGRMIFPAPVYLSLLLPAACALVLCRLRGRGWPTVLLLGLAAPLPVLPALLAPSLSAALVAWAAILLVLGGAVWSGWFSCGRSVGLLCAWCAPAALYLTVLIRMAPFASTRWLAFLHPEENPLGWYYTQLRAGLPVGASYRGSFDLMLSRLSLSPGLGRWVFPAAALLFVLFAALVLRRILRLHSTSGTLVALGAFWPLVLQAALFLVHNLGWSPLAPLSLPFLSYGAGFMAVNLVLAGVLLSVLRMDALARDGASTGLSFTALPETFTLPLPGGALHIVWRKKPGAKRD